MQRQGRGSQETIVQPWGRALASRDIHNSVFKLFIELKPNKWKMSAFFIPEKLIKKIT